MTARAIWQGTLFIQKHRVPVSLYSAVQDQQIHFHLLHKQDKTRVQQRMVDSETNEPVPLDQAQKAFQAAADLFIPVTPEEIEKSVPEPSRELRVTRFVPRAAVEPQLFERPYYLGPGKDAEADYFALANAIEAKNAAGIVMWVMRKHAYVGALIAQDNYLMLITLRFVEEVIPVTDLEPPKGRALAPKEKDLAEKLIEALSGQFEAEAYHDEYQGRVRELVNAKKSGKKIKLKQPRKRPREQSLAESLQASLKAAR